MGELPNSVSQFSDIMYMRRGLHLWLTPQVFLDNTKCNLLPYTLIGRRLRYLGMVGGFCCDNPLFRFAIRLGPYFMPHHDLIDILFLQNFFYLSLSHLVLEILGPKVDLIFHQNVLFKFLSILYKFSPWFLIQLTLILLDLRSFWPFIFIKL